MNKTIYLECYSGISGDMTVGALLDLGADEEVLRKALHTLPLNGYQIEIKRVKKSGLDACDFHVILEEDNHDHDMDYLYGPGHVQPHDHVHGSEAGHPHEHSHVHGPEAGHPHEHSHVHSPKAGHPHDPGHSHSHRGLKEIKEIVENSGLSLRAKRLTIDIFEALACAEAKAHGTSPEEVHFHEVGAVDSIVDIAAAAICFDNLDVSEVIVSELYEGRGTVRCQHGVIPVPVPAVANLAAEHGLILHMTDVEGEMVTPTGAAIAAILRTADHLPDRYRIRKIGMGAGKREYGRAGVVRAMLIEEQE